MTDQELQQNYANECAQLGHKQFSVHTHQKKMEALIQEIADHKFKLDGLTTLKEEMLKAKAAVSPVADIVEAEVVEVAAEVKDA